MSEEKSLPKPPTDLPLPEKELTSSEPQTGQSNIVVKNYTFTNPVRILVGSNSN